VKRRPQDIDGSDDEVLRDLRERIAGVRAVLFDLDGTLLDTVELIRVSFRFATREVLGRAVPDEVTMSGVGRPLVEQFREMAPGREDELVAVYRDFNMARHDELARIYPGTVPTLRALAAMGMPMAVVTSKGTRAASHGLTTFGLAGFFDTVVTADDVDRHKPDPLPLRRAAESLGVDMRYCVYVGDSPHDMQAALAAGAVAVAALWGAFTRSDVLEPDPGLALDRIEDLLPLLQGDVGRFRVRATK
jgi:pyrophosphatase PpaX